MHDDLPPPIEDLRAERARALGLARFKGVVEDVAAGRGSAAHGRLLKLLRSPLPRADRDTIETALADRRLFAEPAARKVGLGRINGVGLGMYGRSAYDPEDASYVKTRCFSFLWVPLFPVDQWLVRDADEGGWYFLGRVPLDLGIRRLRTAALSVAAAIALIAFSIAWWADTHATLHLLNGLDVAAQVTIDDDAPITVAPGERPTVEITAGRHRFRCTVGRRVVDDREEDVSGSADLVAYNVLGAAPLCVHEVVYMDETSGSRSDARAPEPSSELMGGRVYSQRSDVEHVFTTPPEHISLSRGERRKTRRQAVVEDGGWRTTVSMAEEDGDEATAAEVAERVALAEPANEALVAEVTAISESLRSPADHAKFKERLAAARAGDAPASK